VAVGLRRVNLQIEMLVAHWPDLSGVLTNSSRLLQTMRGQLDWALKRRGEYQKAMNQTAILAESFGSMLPSLTEHLTGQLEGEDKALGDLGNGLDEVSGALPAYSDLAARFLAIGRFLAWLVAAIVALHGSYLVLSTRLGKGFSV
jgi:hypothetical protein